MVRGAGVHLPHVVERPTGDVEGLARPVLVRGVAWDLAEGANRITPLLTNIRRLVAITSHGSSQVLNVVEGESWAAGDRPRRARAVPSIRPHHVAGDVRHRPIYRCRATAFLDRVERRMQRL